MDGVTAAWRRWLGSPARDAVANRHAYVASIRERAAQDARRQVDEERLRIARELHDVVPTPWPPSTGGPRGGQG